MNRYAFGLSRQVNMPRQKIVSNEGASTVGNSPTVARLRSSDQPIHTM